MNAFNTKSQAAKADTLRALYHVASAVGVILMARKSAASALLEWARRIARAVTLPVTTDMEAGYADSPEKFDNANEFVFLGNCLSK